MRVISANLNGIRAAGRKGFYDWLAEQDADFICMQETKAQMAVLTDDLYRPPGYHAVFSDAIKKGYSGVGIYSKQEPEQVIDRLGWECADTEGRYIQVNVGDLSVVSLYLPSGSSGDERQAKKIEFMNQYREILAEQLQSGRQYIVCGDWNIVHTEKDIKNFKPNQKTSGCLPEERAWLDELLTAGQWVDAFREVNQERDQYTWWSNRGRAWDNNVGWRIDYQMITPNLKDRVKSVSIYKEQRFSDHAPLIVDYI
jgi:exodeoxyribonuclease III